MKRKLQNPIQSVIPFKKQKTNHSNDEDVDNSDIDEIKSTSLFVNYKKQNIPIQNGEVHYYPSFLTSEFASELFTKLQKIDYNQSKISLYGKKIDVPRLQNWMADDDISASLYQKEKQLPWSKEVRLIKDELEKITNFTFNYVLINLYRNGNDYISYHSDSESIGDGKNIIASVSLGCTRKFVMRHKRWKEDNIEKKEFQLHSGCLLLMIGDETQRHWKHTVPKSKKIVTPRINLTFRHT